jgi:hypothetical protein
VLALAGWGTDYAGSLCVGRELVTRLLGIPHPWLIKNGAHRVARCQDAGWAAEAHRILEGHLEHPDPEVREAAAQALVVVSGER